MKIYSSSVIEAAKPPEGDPYLRRWLHKSFGSEITKDDITKCMRSSDPTVRRLAKDFLDTNPWNKVDYL